MSGKEDMRFSGEGGGVLFIFADGSSPLIMSPSMATHPGEPKDERIYLLHHVSKNSMGDKPIGIADVSRFKGEAQVLLEALRTGDAPFFRSLADAFKPRPAAVKVAKDHAAERVRKDDVVFNAVGKAAHMAGTCPCFDDVLRCYRSQPGCASETPADFKRKLTVRGFAWLCER
jgi:hypothetical protein